MAEFSTVAFRAFLLEELEAIQAQEKTPYQKGALDCLVRVQLGFERLHLDAINIPDETEE